MDIEVAQGMLNLIQKAKADYAAWMGGNNQWMIDEYNAGISFIEGSKYIKIVTKHGSQSSVHSFIVKQDGGKFRRGDILKPASWKTPAMNFARGNVIDGTLDRIRWTGAL